MKPLNFESENLVVNWIRFNIEGLKNLESIGVCLSEKFKFNSSVKKTKNGNLEYFITKAENKFQVSFIVCNYEEFYWTGIKVNFFK